MPIKVEIRERVAEIVLAHPPVNALDSRTWLELAETIERTGRNPEVRCVMIRGEGKGFCAGVDIKELQAHPERIVEVNRGNYLTFRAVRACEVPVVVAQERDISDPGLRTASGMEFARGIQPVALADPRFTVKALAWQQTGLGLSAVALLSVRLPLGGTGAFAGEPGFSFEPAAAAGWKRGALGLLLNAGALVRTVSPTGRLFGLGSEFTWRAGGSYQVNDQIGAVAAVAGAVSSGQAPVEVRLGATFPLGDLNAEVGAGAGLTSALGNPSLRVYVQLR